MNTQFLSNETLICKVAEDIDAGLITAESVLEVLTEDYNKLELGQILDVMERNGYMSVLDKLIIAKHNKLLRLNEEKDYLEACLEL